MLVKLLETIYYGAGKRLNDMSIIKKWFKKQYIKYVLKQCPHICIICEYKSDCLPHYYDNW